MDSSKNLFSHYQQLIKKKQQSFEVIINVIKRKTGITIKREEIKVDGNFLVIKTGSKRKLEIIIKEEEILKELNFLNLKITKIK